jgi:NADH dehydrogenase
LLSSGEEIHTENLIWTAGVKAKRFEGFAPEVYRKDNRIVVDAYNKVRDTYNIFAIGDTCYQTDDTNFPDGYPQVAQVAIQQGKNLARNFQLMAERQELIKFSYKDQGTSVAVGHMKAVASLYKSRVYLSGKSAWLVWLFVHLAPMILGRSWLKLFGKSIRGYFFRRQLKG